MNGPRLRPLGLSDAPRVLDAFASGSGIARQGEVTNLEEAEAYVSRLIDVTGPHRAFAMVGEKDQLLGIVALSIDAANRNAWFWYWTHPQGRGRGWTSRAAATVADWALNAAGLHRLELGHRVNNPASRGVALAAGFIQEGVERDKFLVAGERVDVLTYGRLVTDPSPATVLLPILV